MRYILSHPRLTKSAKPLAEAISKRVGEQIFVSKVPLKGHKLAVRFGNSTIFPNMEDTNYNAPDDIMIAGNKQTLSNYLNLPENKHIKQVELFKYPTHPIMFPLVVRSELNRGGGIGIKIVETMEEYDKYKGNFWSYWYNFQFELGVHVLGGEIKKVFKKVRAVGLEEEKYPIRNTQRGYSFKIKPHWNENYRGLQRFVDGLYKVFPIQFARLDIGYDKVTGGFRLIEINSAPDLSQNINTLEVYAKFLAERII